MAADELSVRCYVCGFIPEDETKLEGWTTMTLEIALPDFTKQVRYMCPDCTKAHIQIAKMRSGY